MPRLRAMFVPLMVLAGLTVLAVWQPSVSGVAQFPFLWDILLGAAIGASFACLPAWADFAPRKNELTAMLWVAAFVTLLVIFYQYLSLVANLSIDELAFLSDINGRARVVEGAVLGYCTLTAGRG